MGTTTSDLSPTMVVYDCRMYEKKYPGIDECVTVIVLDVKDMGAYVSLQEYNNVEGMILLSELSRRRIRSISKLIRKGRQEICRVMRVDEEKGYIDLSKRRVSPAEAKQCNEKFLRSKEVHSIILHCAKTCPPRVTDDEKFNVTEDHYKRYGWPLYAKYGHAYDAFKRAITHEAEVLDGLDMTAEERDVLMTNIRRRLTPTAVKVRSDVDVTCFAYEGIEAIQAALREGEAVSTPETPVQIKLVAPPLYAITCQCLDKTAGLAAVTAAVTAVTGAIKKRQGNLNVKMPPQVMEAESSGKGGKGDGSDSDDDVDEDEDEDEEDDEEEDDDSGDEAAQNRQRSADQSFAPQKELNMDNLTSDE